MGLLQRLYTKLDRSGGPDACWPFVGAQSRGSRRETTYGSIQEGPVRSKVWRVNRLVLLVEEIPRARDLPEGELLQALHQADHRHKHDDAAHGCNWGPCGNPSHLAWKSHKANVQDQAHKRAMGGRIDPTITSEMLWLAARAGAELRAERLGTAHGPWWPLAEDVA